MKTFDKTQRHWIEQYKCGCQSEARLKRELPGYCLKHGNNRTEVYVLDPKANMILSKTEYVEFPTQQGKRATP